MKRVTAAILENAGRIFIARRLTPEAHRGKWEFPGGKIEPRETPAACLQREMREEFDADVTVGAFFGRSVHTYAHGAIELLAYRVTVADIATLTPLEHDKIAWATRADLLNYDLLPADIPFAVLWSAEKRAGRAGKG